MFLGLSVYHVYFNVLLIWMLGTGQFILEAHNNSSGAEFLKQAAVLLNADPAAGSLNQARFPPPPHTQVTSGKARAERWEQSQSAQGREQASHSRLR